MPARGTITAHTFSPQCGSGTPITATSPTPATPWITCSTSSDDTFSPPVTITSFLRSTMARFPAGSEPPDVSGVQPPTNQGRRGGVGFVPVLAHHLGALHQDLADLTGRHVTVVVVDHPHRHARTRDARSRKECRITGQAAPVRGDIEEHRVAGQFGHAVALREVDAQHVVTPLQERHRHRRRSVRDEPEARQRVDEVRPRVEQLEQAVQHGGRE